MSRTRCHRGGRQPRRRGASSPDRLPASIQTMTSTSWVPFSSRSSARTWRGEPPWPMPTPIRLTVPISPTGIGSQPPFEMRVNDSDGEGHCGGARVDGIGWRGGRMTDRISPKQFHESEGVEDWRVIGDGACAYFRTESLATSARLVQAISQVPGVGSARDPLGAATRAPVRGSRPPPRGRTTRGTPAPSRCSGRRCGRSSPRRSG